MLNARNIKLSIAGREVLQDANFSISAREKVALVGTNGSGKSTLLSILAGELEPDAGDVERRTGLEVGRVEQFLPASLDNLTLLDALVEVVPDEPWRAPALLAALGFEESEYGYTVSRLSGGQQNRLMFARALAREPDLLLLDEPTNHLDLASLLVFERALKAFTGGVVLVSHDRLFLENVTSRTVFVVDGRLRGFDATYSAARAALEEQVTAAAEARAVEEKEIAKLRQSAKRLAVWGRTHDNEKLSRRAKAMDRRADKLDAEKTELTELAPLDLSLKLSGTRAKQALVVEDVTVQVAGRVLFEVGDLLIRPGERVALLGANGLGKSTFIKKLVAACADPAPGIDFNPQTVLGYYDQELEEASTASTMLEFVSARAGVREQTALRALVHAGFAYSDQSKRVRDLSGGERARVLFVILSLNRPNFMILDEPTNHIDIQGKEQLEDALLGSEATLIVTSHDRRFLETVTDRYLWIRDGQLTPLERLETYFEASLSGSPSGIVSAKSSGQLAQESSEDATPVSGSPAEHDEVLERIERLEGLLADDLARKPKFQKPDRQAEWRVEIERLYATLEDA